MDLRHGRIASRHHFVLRPAINTIETEKHDPSLPLAFKVARLFKASIEEIFELDQD